VLATLALPLMLATVVWIGELGVLPAVAAKTFMPLFLLLGVVGLMLVPCLLYRRALPPPGPSDSDGGGGSGPGRPPSSPDAPRGGIPLPDADPASARARDHTAPVFDRPNRRRPAHAPARKPAKPRF
jgi:hypothetical protein